MGKFTTHNFWKRKGDCCDFIEVKKVIGDNGISAELKVSLHTRIHGGWKTLVKDMELRISKRDYVLWNQYTPNGMKNDSQGH